MNTRVVEIRNPATGAVTGTCQGPTPAGSCPYAGRDGVVPCAGRLVGPAEGDPRCWPVWVPPGCRQCRITFNDQAVACLRAAERYRDQWDAGLHRERERVRALAARKDPRFRGMSDRQLQVTALWRWRLSGPAQGLRHAEQKQRDWGRMYLALAEQQRAATPPVVVGGAA
ncbi:hypothetical protein [Actinoplanes sp. L3-i22]|uniref:hypothetical protein n=1 Tax=Actinoplanes sp. L3-i22 TaxID=2836373 RepID=UPI001C74DEAB|nr:hypothetical protein [Actinoplanes sp. L3-i22]BCY09403.1 hypothetical protein L3i22_044910 [Actinoplanes sp. L3-i22]